MYLENNTVLGVTDSKQFKTLSAFNVKQYNKVEIRRKPEFWLKATNIGK